MANFRRRRPRLSTTHTGYSHRAGRNRYAAPGHRWMGNWPAWWDLVFHTRPRRRRTREAVVLIMQGRDPDGITWPVAKKPHVYYW